MIGYVIIFIVMKSLASEGGSEGGRRRRQRAARPLAGGGAARTRSAPRPLPRAQSALGRRTAFACVRLIYLTMDTRATTKRNR